MKLLSAPCPLFLAPSLTLPYATSETSDSQFTNRCQESAQVPTL
jgi:hypothetical protein